VIAGMKFTTFLTPDMASKNDARHGIGVFLALNKSMPCLASFFDAMSGVKKLPNFVPAINCTSSANELSTAPLTWKNLKNCSIQSHILEYFKVPSWNS